MRFDDSTLLLQNVNISLASRHLLELEKFRGLEYAEKTRTFMMRID
jgi:hypothetical protein